MDERRENVIPSVHKHLEDFREREMTIDVNLGGNARREETMRKKRLNDLPPKHVHGGNWKDMINLTNSHQRKRSSNVSQTSSFHNIRSRAASCTKSNIWIENNLKKCECCLFVPSNKYSTRCSCGRSIGQHPIEVQQTVQSHKFLNIVSEKPDESDNHESIKISNASKKPHGYRWTITRNTKTAPTDAYGTIVFEGSARQSRAQFVRTSFDTEPATLIDLLYGIWKLPPPKLIITIHGGLTNFDLQPKLARIVRKGIMKAARSTDAWIITSGLNAGVVPHIAPVFDGLEEGDTA